MKFWLIALLAIPVLASAQAGNSPSPEIDEADDELPVNWVDSTHALATDNAQALTLWLDEFFGDPLYDAERAESYLRTEFINDWDQEDGNSFKVRLRGQVQLPKISQRVHLVFSGEESDDLEEDERDREDSVGLQYTVNEGGRSRLDATLGVSSGHLKPGIRYRNEAPFADYYSYRFTQRVQYADDDQLYSTTLVDLNRSVTEDAAWRWSNRFVYGERTEGVEWRTRLSLRHRYREHTQRPIGMNYFLVATGVTRPESLTKNVRYGVTFRRQFYRDYLFFEVEPAYNLRRLEYEDQREGQWSLVLRLEIALERDLRRVSRRRENSDVDTMPQEAATRAPSDSESVSPPLPR